MSPPTAANSALSPSSLVRALTPTTRPRFKFQLYPVGHTYTSGYGSQRQLSAKPPVVNVTNASRRDKRKLMVGPRSHIEAISLTLLGAPVLRERLYAATIRHRN